MKERTNDQPTNQPTHPPTNQPSKGILSVFEIANAVSTDVKPQSQSTNPHAAVSAADVLQSDCRVMHGEVSGADPGHV